MGELTARSALTIGLSQALALLPGISRSGATITAGLGLGLTREAAARFSFLLATPITLGAGLYGSRKLLTEPHPGSEWLAMAVGFGVAAVSGMIAIGFLLAWLRSRSVTIFSLYRIAFAALVGGARLHRPLGPDSALTSHPAAPTIARPRRRTAPASGESPERGEALERFLLSLDRSSAAPRYPARRCRSRRMTWQRGGE